MSNGKTRDEIDDARDHRLDILWLSGEPMPGERKLGKLLAESIEETMRAMGAAEKRDEAKRERDEEKGAD